MCVCFGGGVGGRGREVRVTVIRSIGRCKGDFKHYESAAGPEKTII